MSRKTYVYRDGELVEKHLARPNGRRTLNFVPDIQPFTTQDGTHISSRSQLRHYERAHGVKQVGNDWTGSERPQFWDSIKR